MRTVDRIFGWLLLASSLFVAILAGRSFVSHRHDLPWTAGHCVAILLLGACNLMRAERPHDRTLALVCFAGNAMWGVLALVYVMQRADVVTAEVELALATALLIFSSRTRRRSRPM